MTLCSALYIVQPRLLKVATQNATHSAEEVPVEILQQKTAFGSALFQGHEYPVLHVVTVQTGYIPERTTYRELITTKLYHFIYSPQKAAEKLAKQSSVLNVVSSTSEFQVAKGSLNDSMSSGEFL